MTDHDESLPVTTLLPETAADPVILFDGHAALRFAVVERAYALRIRADEWDRPGVYILLDAPEPASGTWGCYVGKAPAGLRTRLRDHVRNKDHWRRALLIQRDTTHGFNSAQVAWLEGRIYDLLDAAEDARPSNANRPSDETLPAFERASLENAITPISRVLRLLGYDPATADDVSASAPTAATRAGVRTRTSRFVGITLKNLLDAGYVQAGATLVSTNTVWPATATVDPEGTVRYQGVPYTGLSTAGKAVRGSSAPNGWEFWAVEDANGKTPLATIRARYLETVLARPSS